MNSGLYFLAIVHIIISSLISISRVFISAVTTPKLLIKQTVPILDFSVKNSPAVLGKVLLFYDDCLVNVQSNANSENIIALP